MLEAIVCKKSQDDRTLALSLACHLYCEAERPTAWLEQLKEAASSSPELSALLEQCTAPPTSPVGQDWEAKAKQRQIERDAAQVAEKRKRDEYFDALRAKLADLRKAMADDPGMLSGEVFNLYRVGLRAHASHTSYSFANWRALESEFGYDVAKFYRDATIALWRNHNPQIRPEGAEPNTTTVHVQIGLSGLAIESKEESGWLDTLTSEDAARACRYASFELNGFPPWYAELFGQFPDVVGGFLLQEIRYELEQDAAGAKLNHVIERLAWAGQWAWNWLAPHILSILTSHEPTKQESLDALLFILSETSLGNEVIAELCDKKWQEHTELTERSASWQAAWIGTSPNQGITNLIGRVEAAAHASLQTEFVMQCITRITGSRRGRFIVARDAFQDARYLKQLHLLSHQYVRLEDDIDRSIGGVYSPGLRDYAQDARHAFLALLEKLPGKDAYLALCEIAEDAQLPHTREWIRKKAAAKATIAGDLEPWFPEQVREFQMNLERTPRCHKELAEFAKLRLLDLKDEWENGDYSIASTLLQTIETDIRRFICSILNQQSMNRYQVNPEVELADGKRPDLRMDGMGFNEPVPIELKLANKWAGNKLVERLENQLGGDYLRDRRSARGIFLMINQKAGKKWRIGRKHLGFEELVPALQGQWESIKGRYPNIDAIDVIGIDLTARKR